jgi:hypothetical protein
MKKIAVIIMLTAVLLSGCNFIPVNINISVIKGSGSVTSETRTVTGFTSVSLVGSADVDVKFGDTESVVVSADDNIVPLIETKVENNQLIIGSKPGVRYSTTNPVIVTLTMKSMDSAVLSGSGNFTVHDISADSLKLDLTGSGNLTVNGTANSVAIMLSGSGNVTCDGLQAKDASVTITGSGNVSVYASSSLDAVVSGSGNIKYSGNPASVNKSVTGSGTIGQ